MTDDFDLSNFVKITSLTEVKAKGEVPARLVGKPITVFYRDDEVYAMEMSCKHQGADLSRVKLFDDMVTCPRHGWKYDILNGECVNANSPSLREHDVKIVDDQVYVSLMPASR